jgi:hypothetical protein
VLRSPERLVATGAGFSPEEAFAAAIERGERAMGAPAIT